MQYLKDYLDYAVLGVLGVMSFLMLALVIERYLYLARVDLGRFADQEELNLALTNNLNVHRDHRLQCPLCRPAGDGARDPGELP